MNDETKAPRKPRAKKADAAKAPRKPRAKAGKAAATRKPRGERPAPTGKGIEALTEAAKNYNHDKEHKTAGGHVSVNNGDELATKLLGKDLDFVYAHAAKLLKVDEAELRTKYAHLNVGMQRMNLGNRMRAAMK